MNPFNIVCLLIFGISPVFAYSATLPEILTGNSLLGKHPETSAAAKPPHPASLSADWWRYFEVAPGVLKQRIASENRLLQTLLQNLPANLKPEAEPLIASIAENLQSLLELRSTVAPQPPPIQPLQKTYTLEKWLDIVHQRRAFQTELQSEQEDLLRNEKRLNAARQRLDSLTAAYLQSSGNIKEGLEVMAAGAELAVDDEQLRLQKAALAVHKTQSGQLVEESSTAQDRLVVSEDDLQRFKQEIEELKRQLAVAHENFSELEAITVTENLSTEEGKARALLFEQRLRQKAIEEAIADVALRSKEIELDLAQVLANPDKIRDKSLRKQLQNNLDHIISSGASLTAWRQEVVRDQGRAAKSLTAVFETDEKQRAELIDIAQQRFAEAQSTLLSLQRLDDEIHDALLFGDRLRTLIAAHEGVLKTGLENVKTSTTKLFASLWEHLSSSLFKIGETPVTVLGILRVLIIVVLAWALSHFVRRGLTHLSERQRGSSTFLYTLGRLAHYLILIVGISIGLSSIGVDLSNFALIAGALSLGIGFGLQTIVSNFVSGLIVLFERSLRVGDFVELSSGLAGEVRAINVRSTLVTTTDMVEILVPNSEFVNGKVINWTLTDASRRIHIPFGISYGTDKELVRKAALEAAEKIPYTVKDRIGREPDVWLTNFGDSSLNFELVVWVKPEAVKRPNRVRAAYYWELETALNKYGIVIPFPQRDLHIRDGLPEKPALIEKLDPVTETKRD